MMGWLSRQLDRDEDARRERESRPKFRSVQQTGLGPGRLLVRLDCGHLALPRAPFTAVIPCRQCGEEKKP